MMEENRELIRRAASTAEPPHQRGMAFGEIVRRYQDLAYACALALVGDSHLAEDCAQEAFVTAWLQLEQLREPEAFPGWLRRIVATQCHRATRGKRYPSVALEAIADLPCPAADPHRAAERSELRRRVLAAVAVLPEHERLATTLFYVAEYSQKEIAAFLELPLTTIQKRLFSARRRLKGCLADLLPERTIAMVQDNLQESRPSRDDRFANAVRFFNAVALGDLAQVDELLRQDATLATASGRGQWGDRTPLHVAAEKGHAGIAALLLEHGADVAARDQGDNATPLHWAAGNGHVEVARLLVEAGADVNAGDDMHERGPLGWAVSLSEYRPEMAAFLIERGARVDIFAAIALDDADRVRALVAADPSVLQVKMSLCEDYQQPLHFAVAKDRPGMLNLLLDLGADAGATTPSGRTPLCVAAERGKEELAQILLQRGAAVDLLAAIALGKEERALQLLEAGTEPARSNQALLAAAHHGRETVAARLLDLGADVNTVGVGDWLRGTTPLILAANGNHPPVARLLVERGADVRFKDEYPGATALHFAAWHGSRELGALLLDRGADLSAKDDMFDADPLGWAAENKQSEMVDFLIERGAPVDISRAAYFGKIDLVRSLLKADPGLLNFRGNYGTALHQAALHGHGGIVALLLENGADTALPNRHGDSVLMMVRKARKGLAHPSNLEAHAAIEELLVKHGAKE